MVSEPRESQGPDRCRGSLRCLEFHDPTVGDLGGHYNCCCCEPCNNVRPFMAAWNQSEHEWAVCCNCAPRMLYVRFEPDDLDGECCITAGVPMFHGADNENIELLHSVYTGSLFSIGIRIELGQVWDGYDVVCGWKIELERNGHNFLPDVDYSSIVPIDHDTVTCLAVPEISVPCIGPDECPGQLVLENVPVAKLPYIEREDVVEFESHRIAEYDPECLDDYGQPTDDPACDPKFYDLDPPCGWPAVLVEGERWLEELPQYQWNDSATLESVYWSTDLERWVIGEEEETPVAYGPADYAGGEPYGDYFADPDCVSEEECPYEAIEVTRDPYGQCTQVCSRLQERRIGRNFPFNCMEWRWFDDSYEYGGETVLSRGWRHTDPRNDEEETLYLEEDDERRCQVRPDFKASGTSFGPALIEVVGGCSCALNVTVIAAGVSSAIFRCGFCQRWDYFCGTCRCVPATLCVAFFDGETFYPNIILTWDEEERRWGDAYDLLQIEISKDEVLGCVITPVLPFEWTPPESQVVHDCSDEFTFEGKRIQSASNVLNASFHGTREIYDEEMTVSITASSLVPHCDSGPCTYLPCDERCGSNPETVVATVEVYYYALLKVGEVFYLDPYNSGYCSFSVELSYIRSVISIGIEGIEIGCGYEGWYQPGGVDCGTYHISYTQGRVVIVYIGKDATTDDEMVVEQCDPFYASTNEEDPVAVGPGGLWSGENWPQLPAGSGADIHRCLGCEGWGIVYRVVITE